MQKLAFLGLAIMVASTPAIAQDATGRCATPDSIAVIGAQRVAPSVVVLASGLKPHTPLNYRDVQRAIRDVYATGDFEDVALNCSVASGGQRAILNIEVHERPLLVDADVTGMKELPEHSVRDRLDLILGRPADPASVARVVSRIDSLYQSRGYYLARVKVDSMRDAKDPQRLRIAFRIDEGRRLAISGIRINGNTQVSDEEIVKAMKSRPEGFFWWKKGEFDETKYGGDLGERIPTLYSTRGLIDFQVTHDSLIVDPEKGKALIDITVDEGKRYRVGSFEVIGNRRFSSDEIARFYPFEGEQTTLTQRLTGVVRRSHTPKGTFDQARWDDATGKLRTAYSNEGYIYANIRPVVDRTRTGPDSVPTVNLRWEIDERSPAIINRVEIAGNDYTTESCIRDQLIILPGDVFNQDRLVRSYQNIANLGFFETPLPPPDTRPANDSGDVDIVFHVKEKKTGNVNFGASVGQGTGVGGFIGLEQPNLFGQCKRGSLQWQFGKYINDFQLSYTDPSIRQSRVSSTVSAYRTQSKYRFADLGRSTRIGGSIQFGFPLRNSPFTRLYLSYGGERVKYGNSGLFGTLTTACNNCFRSTVGAGVTRDTRIDLPFASGGSMQSINGDFNGGPIGGTANFQRYIAEMRSYTTLATFGGSALGSQPIKLVAGLTARAGGLFGASGPFFATQAFSMGGTQYGEQLRGYDEFAITPHGIDPTATTGQVQVGSFGNAFFRSTAELGVRFNSQLYFDAFMDAGNLWQHPNQIDPTRLFRGAGIGVAIVTPLGPLGLDWAYGFDALNTLGQRDPKWKLHFKLGNLF